MNGICKVDNGRALREGNNVALRGKNKGLVVEDIYLERTHELVRIAGIVLGLDELADPLQLVVYLLGALLARLVLPVRGNTVFGYAMHLPCSYLHLKRYPAPADNGGMERTVHIRLRR